MTTLVGFSAAWKMVGGRVGGLMRVGMGFGFSIAVSVTEGLFFCLGFVICGCCWGENSFIV